MSLNTRLLQWIFDGHTRVAMITARSYTRLREALQVTRQKDQRSGSEFAAWIAGRRRGSMGWHSMDGRPITAEPAVAIQRAGWEYGPGTTVRIGPRFAWVSTMDLDRSLASQLQSWRFLDSILLHHDETDSLEDLRWIAEVVESWWTFATVDPPERSMTWTGWATTLRVPRLVGLMARLAGTPLRTWLPMLTEVLMVHAERLATDTYFNPRNNHGLFAAAAQLTAADALEPLLDVTEWRDQAQTRMQGMLSTQFAPDGGHKEHSPSYHRLVLIALTDLVRSGLVAAEDLPFRIEDAHAALAWMTQPNGRLAQFGDTGEDRAYVPDLGQADPPDVFVLSGGRHGRPGTARSRLFPLSGWVFVRSPTPASANLGDASYLAWLTGFHSRAHKHADDLTFIWCEGATEIVVDGGKFGYGDLLDSGDPLRRQGYYYSSARRRYVESTRAHNTVVLGRDGVIDRTRPPYGSGRPSLTEDGSVYEMAARAVHETYTHHRSLRFEPGRWLLVRDIVDIEGDDADGVTAWLNLNGEFEIEGSDARSVRFEHSGSGMQVVLEVTAADGEVMSLAHGQVDPVAGWRSITDGRLIPAWNVGISGPGRRRAVLEYRLSLTLPRSPSS